MYNNPALIYIAPPTKSNTGLLIGKISDVPR